KILPRFYPQGITAQSNWGCSSLSGFLAKDQNLLDCCNEDMEILKQRKVSYHTISNRLLELIEATKPLGKKIIDGKFEVTIEGAYNCSQFCPFSPVDDMNASPFAPVEGACGEGNFDVEIKNLSIGKSIKFGSLLPHLIGKHHFFEGNVEHRLDPVKVIETLELKPEDPFSLFFNPSEEENEPKVKKIHQWQLMYGAPTTLGWEQEFMSWCQKNKNLEPIVCNGDAKIWVLPFSGRESPDESLNPNFQYLHLFNNGGKEVTVEKVIEGAKFQCTIPNGKLAVFSLKKQD
ncbi:MAG: hypothetical protein AAGG81_02915, partial [Chlamydiota bacterium]